MMTTSHTEIPVQLPPRPSRQYNIAIGEDLLSKVGSLLLEKTGPRRCLIVTDEHVAPLYLVKTESSLRQAGHTVLSSLIVPAGEESKSLPTLARVWAEMAEKGADRKTLLIALGGGVVGDLTGFAAATYMRGMDFIQIPTTLLAQVDSSVGGKTGINMTFGKNVIGAFEQPQLVVADISTLETLPPRDLLSGYAEIVKYGLIISRPFFDWCREHSALLMAGDAAIRAKAVEESCRFKAQIVEKDEKEAGVRALLNMGHTFGHALESATGYDPEKLRHGEAVAIGTVMAFRLSVTLGYCSPTDADAVEAHFKDIGLPTTLPPLPTRTSLDQLMAYMTGDKKAEAGKITLILAKGIGEAFVAKECDPAPIRALWARML